MRADAFGPRIEMAAQTKQSRGAKKILILTANGFCYGDCRGQRPEWRRQIEGA